MFKYPAKTTTTEKWHLSYDYDAEIMFVPLQTDFIVR